MSAQDSEGNYLIPSLKQLYGLLVEAFLPPAWLAARRSSGHRQSLRLKEATVVFEWLEEALGKWLPQKR